MYNLQLFRGVGIELPGHLKTVQIGENSRRKSLKCTDMQSSVNFAFCHCRLRQQSNIIHISRKECSPA